MLILPAEITHDQARATLHLLRQGVGPVGGAPVLADASGLQRFDSSALAVLLALRRDCVERGLSFSVRGLPGALRELAVLYGVGELLPAAP
jgi:phospholipid transport system transporter-binding protein